MAKLSKDELIISIHAPTRGATDMTGRFNETHVQFQSTLPREERLYSNGIVALFKDFNPRSHERSDKHVTRSDASIFFISIHAPTRGATQHRLLNRRYLIYFNPRSHERSDSNIAQKICLFLYNTDNKYIIR